MSVSAVKILFAIAAVIFSSPRGSALVKLNQSAIVLSRAHARWWQHRYLSCSTRETVNGARGRHAHERRRENNNQLHRREGDAADRDSFDDRHEVLLGPKNENTNMTAPQSDVKMFKKSSS